MFIDTLDHYNICTRLFRQTIDFYTNIMGLKLELSEIGDDAPDSRQWAAFLRDPEGRAIVHVIGLNERSSEYILQNNLAHRRRRDTDPAYNLDHLVGTGVVDHMAFDCRNFPEALATFRLHKIPFRYFKTQRTGIHQLFVRDPNGVVLELNFAREEVPEDIVSGLSKGPIAAEASPPAGP